MLTSWWSVAAEYVSETRRACRRFGEGHQAGEPHFGDLFALRAGPHGRESGSLFEGDDFTKAGVARLI
jgi:uncharacterized protein with PIN domain